MGRIALITGWCCALLLLPPQVVRSADSPGSDPLKKTVSEETADRRQYLATGGLALQAADEVTLEPLFGVGHDLISRGALSTSRETHHSFTAQAGGRISILKGMYVSAAVKYPVYSFQDAGPATAGRVAAPGSGPELLNNPLTWTGEVGTTIGTGFRSYLYYDNVAVPVQGGAPGPAEDRIGIGIQYNFK